MNKLLIMRHGQAEMHAASDAERALTPVGVVEAQRMAVWLSDTVGEVSLILHSPYLRAKQTAAEIKRYFDAARLTEFEGLTPNDRPATVVEYLESHAGTNCLCVSHQPLVGELRNYLVDGLAGAGYPFPTASIAMLEYELLGPGCAVDCWHKSPAELK